MIGLLPDKLGQVFLGLLHQGIMFFGIIRVLRGHAQTSAHLQIPGLAQRLRHVVALLEHVKIINGHVAVALLLKSAEKRQRPNLGPTSAPAAAPENQHTNDCSQTNCFHNPSINYVMPSETPCCESASSLPF